MSDAGRAFWGAMCRLGYVHATAEAYDGLAETERAELDREAALVSDLGYRAALVVTREQIEAIIRNEDRRRAMR